MRRTAVRIGMLVLLPAVPANAQQKPKEPVTLRGVLLEGWNEIGNKVVPARREFPGREV